MNDLETDRSYRIFAKVYSHVNEYNLAIEILKKALKIHETIAPDIELISSDMHTKLASYHKRKQEYHLSVRHYEYATNVYKNLQRIDYNILFSLYEQLVGLYHQQKDYSSVLETYQQMVGISENIKRSDQYKIAKLYSEIFKIDRYGIAMNYCTKSMEIIERQCNNQYSSAAKKNEILGTIYCYYEDQILAENYYKKALELFIKADAHEDVKRIEKTLEHSYNSTSETSPNKKASHDLTSR